MLLHYLKVAVRNLLKYKMQSAISIVGLAIGFACFALSSIWLKYEMTYDTHWPDGERIFHVGIWRENEMEKFIHHTSFLEASHIKETFPEIEASCAIFHQQKKEKGKDIYILKTDSAYTKIFPLTILQGNDQFLYDDRLAGITESGAKRLFGTTDVLGKTLSKDLRRTDVGDEYTICALLKDMEGHSCYPYDVLLSSKDERQSWGYLTAYTFVKLVAGTDVKALDKKLKQNRREETFNLADGETHTMTSNDPLAIVPISSMHYTYPTSTDSIHLEHIRLFNAVGVVIVVCALLNYLILYIIRLYIRRREMALRRVHGASEGNLLRMTTTEFLLLTAFAIFVGMMIIECLFKPFKEMVGIHENVGFLYCESAFYIGVVVIISTVISAFILYAQQRHSLRTSLQPISSSGRFFTFRRLSMAIQLFVSIFVLFATLTLQKQLHHLHHSSDMGLNMDVVIAEGWLSWAEEDVDAAMEQLPYLKYYKTEEHPFDTRSYRTGSYNIKHEHERGEVLTIQSKKHRISYDIYQIFGMQIVAGEAPKEKGNEQSVWINEAFATKLGYKPEEAIGKQLYSVFLAGWSEAGKEPRHTIRGVIKNMQLSPILPPSPSVYQVALEEQKTFSSSSKSIHRKRFLTSSIGDVNVLEDSVRSHLQRTFPHVDSRYMHMGFYTVREEIEKALQSERMLMKLLGIASGVCVLITLFGIFSMVSLTCERRRKEMAIRKVHGAKIGHVIGLFVKEYGILLLVSSVVAFSVGYVVMKQWLQTYVIQTAISWWIYATILLTVTLLIVLCVGYRVWKAANENPADVVKSE